MSAELDKISNQLKEYFSILQEAKDATSKSKGRIEGLLSQLKEYKLDSVEEALKFREKLEGKLEEEKKILLRQLEELNKVYGLPTGN